MTPYYQDSHCTIYHGDCREIMPQLPKVDLVLTDPPYGINHATNYAARGRSNMAACNDYPKVHGDDEPFDPAHIIALKVPTLLWGGNYFADKLEPSGGWIIWDKLRPHGLDQATAEIAWTNFVKGARVFRHLWNGMMRASEHGENYHPTQKPVALWLWVFGLPWIPNGLSVDPYMGGGAMLVAAKQLNRNAIGIEVEERYCEITAKRLAQECLIFPQPKPDSETQTQTTTELL